MVCKTVEKKKMHDMYEIGREYKYDNQLVARHLPVNKYAVIPTHGHEIV
jgi:hypothetical protein